MPLKSVLNQLREAENQSTKDSAVIQLEGQRLTGLFGR